MKIDRKALVERHNIRLNEANPKEPLTVGNGHFGFTVDATGLQTFPQLHRRHQPLCTLAEWGWHSYPMPEYMKKKEFKYEMIKSGDRYVSYPTSSEGQGDLFNYLRANPHRFHLGMIGFHFAEKTEISDIENIDQKLDMYRGVITSKFTVRGVPVEVTTVAMHEYDAVGVHVKSPLLTYGNMTVRFDFPYAANPDMINAAAAEFSVCEGNTTEIIDGGDGFTTFRRKMDETEYFVKVNREDCGFERTGVMNYDLLKYFGDEMSFVVQFSKDGADMPRLKFADVLKSSEAAMKKFWDEGGIIDFSECDDERAKVLEDRMIKSLYITRINSCANFPPQESGFTCNSGWYGKSHLEMHYWHAGYFPLWSRPELLEVSLNSYLDHMDACEWLAKRQGFKGIRIPKFIGPDFVDAPSSISPLLLWQQPHPTMMAELIYRAKPEKEILERYFPLVEKTSEFMLDILRYDENEDVYNLDAPYIPAQEFHNRDIVKNAVYEIEYFHFALEIYRKWCERLGKEPLPELDEKLAKLAKSPVIDGLYPAHANCPETFTKFNIDHPSMLCAYGVLPGWRMDEATVRRTLDKVLECWEWDTTWGWDYALLSMCAAKLGDSETAVDVLLRDTSRNRYSKNGHVYQYPGLSCYIDTNGALLLALGFLAAGCDSRPGNLFPKSWQVKVEGINKHV